MAKIVKTLVTQLSARENFVEPFPYMPITQRFTGWRDKYQPGILPLAVAPSTRRPQLVVEKLAS